MLHHEAVFGCYSIFHRDDPGFSSTQMAKNHVVVWWLQMDFFSSYIDRVQEKHNSVISPFSLFLGKITPHHLFLALNFYTPVGEKCDVR